MCWYWCFWLPGARRGVSTSKLGVSYAATRPLLLAGATLAGAVSIYSYTKHKSLLQLPLPVTYAASTPAHQDNVTSFILVICTTSTAHFNYITCEISIIKNNEMSDFQSQPPPPTHIKSGTHIVLHSQNDPLFTDFHVKMVPFCGKTLTLNCRKVSFFCKTFTWSLKYPLSRSMLCELQKVTY